MGSIPEEAEHPLRIFIFDTARTNCQCFYKLFSQHPQLGWGKFFHGYASAAMYGPNRMQQRFRHSDAAQRCQIEWGNEYPSENWKTYESSTKDLLEKIEETGNEVSRASISQSIVRLTEHCGAGQNLLRQGAYREPAQPGPNDRRPPS